MANTTIGDNACIVNSYRESVAKTTMTTNRDEAYIERVLVLVKDKGQVKNALKQESVTTIGQLRNILRDPNKINALKWKNNQNQEKDVSTVFKRSLREMESFINYTQNRTRPLSMGAVDLTGITPEEYEDFVSAGLPSFAYDDAKAQAAFDRYNKTSSSDATSRLALWNKYAIKNKDDFPYLSKAYEWVSFCKKFDKVARNQGLEDVLRSNYVPRSPEEIDLFQKQCTFIYIVLTSKVTLSEGKIIIQQFEDDPYCGQKAWTALSDEYSQSMHGELRRKDLLGYITNTNIPEYPKRSFVTYMEEFQSWYREYNELAPSSDAKMTLEQFVEFLYSYCQFVPSIKSLQEKNRWDKYRDSQNGNTKSTVTPSMEVKMITDTLITADQDRLNQKPLAAQLKKQYNAYVADVDVYDDASNLNTVYDDAPQERSVQVAVRGRAREKGMRIPAATWVNMSSSDKTAWNSISGESQIAIAGSLVKDALEAMAQQKKAQETKQPAVSFKSALPSPRAGLSLGGNPPVAKGARTANMADHSPADIENVGASISELVLVSENDVLLQGNTATISEAIENRPATISEAIENETFGPTAFLDTIRNQRNVYSATSSPADSQAMRNLALSYPFGDLRRQLSQFALDNTPVVRITDDDSVPALRENNSAHIKFVHEEDSLTTPSTVTGSYNTYGDDPDELSYFDAMD